MFFWFHSIKTVILYVKLLKLYIYSKPEKGMLKFVHVFVEVLKFFAICYPNDFTNTVQIEMKDKFSTYRMLLLVQKSIFCFLVTVMGSIIPS